MADPGKGEKRGRHAGGLGKGSPSGGGYNCETTAVRLPFDCNSTALRPFDDLRYDRRLALRPE